MAVCTKLNSVYLVVLPRAVDVLLSRITIGVSFGLHGLNEVFACLGLQTYGLTVSIAPDANFNDNNEQAPEA